MPKRKPNSGSFKPGPDKRRHTFTRAERRRGYRTAMATSNPQILAWVYYRVRGYYRGRLRDDA